MPYCDFIPGTACRASSPAIGTMFLNETHLSQLLSEKFDFTVDQHERELHELCLPGWLRVGTTAELKRHNNYFTNELLRSHVLAGRFDVRVGDASPIPDAPSFTSVENESRCHGH